MDRVPINPGTVDWSGENPGMYLKESSTGPFVTLISFFRVVLSPHGRGHAVLLFLDPHGDGTAPGRPNLCVTDNELLARYLVENFAVHFAAFRGVPALRNFRTQKGTHFVASGDGHTSYTETFQSESGPVTLTWKQLGDPFMVELPKEKSATGQHEMFSLFVTAGGVEASIDRRAIAGKPVPRDLAGKQTSTAFLAFSETWVRR